MTRAELDALFTVPDHKVVTLKFDRPKKEMKFKTAAVLQTQTESDEEGKERTFYSLNDYLVVEGSVVGLQEPFVVGRVIAVHEDYTVPRILHWATEDASIQKFNDLNGMEARITDLHSRLDAIWSRKTKGEKLDVLFDEYISEVQAEATLENEIL